MNCCTSSFASVPKAENIVYEGGGGTVGRETGRKGGGRCTGDGRRGGGKWDSQGGEKREKTGKITQHCAIFHNRKNAKGWEPKNTGREPGLKGTGSWRFKPPCPLPPPMKRLKTKGLYVLLLRIRGSIFAIKILAKATAILVPMAVACV